MGLTADGEEKGRQGAVHNCTKGETVEFRKMINPYPIQCVPLLYNRELPIFTASLMNC